MVVSVYICKFCGHEYEPGNNYARKCANCGTDEYYIRKRWIPLPDKDMKNAWTG